MPLMILSTTIAGVAFLIISAIALTMYFLYKKNASESIKNLNEQLANLDMANNTLRIYSAALASISDEIMILESDGKIEYGNRALEAHTHFAAEELIGTYAADYLTADYRKLFSEILSAANEAGAWYGEIQFLCKNGDFATNEIAITPIMRDGEKTKHFVMVMRDIEEKRKTDRQLFHLAHFDLLTDLPNRVSFAKEFESRKKEAETAGAFMGVLFLDIDKFKYINDTFGHNVGDELIIAAGERLKSVLPQNAYISRTGGDEFDVLLYGINDPAQIARTSESIVEQCSVPYDVGGHKLLATFSIGSSTYPTDSEDLDTLLKNADEAMYTAKSKGRDSYVPFTEDMHSDLMRRIKIENMLKRDIAAGCTNFIPYFQPKLDPKTNRIDSCEVLIRWRSAGQLISPADFIPIAEETGLILQITRRMLVEACRSQKAFKAMGYDIIVSVNATPHDLMQEDFLETLDLALAGSGMDSSKLDIEITESTLVDDAKILQNVVQELHKRSITVTIDDFGTGYSSFGYFKQFSINGLKIDRSFVIGIDEGDADAIAIMEAVFAMSRSLNLIVTAEGVENQIQFDWLKEMGCDEIQGYYISEPVPLEGLLTLLQKYNTNGIEESE